MTGLRNSLIALILLGTTAIFPAEAKDRGDKHWRKHAEKEARQYRYENRFRNNDDRYYRNWQKGQRRGLDRNRDGYVDRWEWRASQRSWERQRQNRQYRPWGFYDNRGWW